MLIVEGNGSWRRIMAEKAISIGLDPIITNNLKEAIGHLRKDKEIKYVMMGFLISHDGVERGNFYNGKSLVHWVNDAYSDGCDLKLCILSSSQELREWADEESHCILASESKGECDEVFLEIEKDMGEANEPKKEEDDDKGKCGYCGKELGEFAYSKTMCLDCVPF
jgi:hypothetical protein